MAVTSPAADRPSLRALDALNVALPEVAAGIGPFLVVWMSATLRWNAGRIGILMGVSGMIGVLAQGPGGALVDRSCNKRMLVAGAAAAIALACVAMAHWPAYGVVLAMQSAIGTAGALLARAAAPVASTSPTAAWAWPWASAPP